MFVLHILNHLKAQKKKKKKIFQVKIFLILIDTVP